MGRIAIERVPLFTAMRCGGVASYFSVVRPYCKTLPCSYTHNGGDIPVGYLQKPFFFSNLKYVLLKPIKQLPAVETLKLAYSLRWKCGLSNSTFLSGNSIDVTFIKGFMSGT